MKLHYSEKEWSLEHQGSVLLRSSEAFPFLFAGIGQETVDMYRGNFKIEDYVTERRPLAVTAVLPLPDIKIKPMTMMAIEMARMM